ncbi:MAG: hypothetical protein ACXW3X_10145 [Rhodoplanes sp.]
MPGLLDHARARNAARRPAGRVAHRWVRRRATVLFEVDEKVRRVVIHGIYYAGRSFEGEADNDEAG